MNNTEHGSIPISQLTRIGNTIEIYKKYFDEQYPNDTDDSCADVLPKIDQYKWDYYNSLILLSSILTASKCDTIEQVISKLNATQHPTITDTEIERMAKEFSINNAFNSSFIPDILSFIAGYKQALSMMPQSEGCEAKLTQAIERMDRARSILNKQDGSSNWGMLDTSYLLPNPPKK